MSGIFGGGNPAPAPAPAVSAAQLRAEERANAQEKSEMQGVQKRRRARRTGGMRLLFSPARQEGPNQAKYTKLGGGS
tara:strand:+ start:395 stop:625 length:231 start_codon:yes stop_codon:yes gene_type:complete